MLQKFRGSYFAYFLMYTFYFLSWSLFSTLISVYLMAKGYSAQDVSIVVSGSFIASLLTQPLIGWLNDRFGVRRVSLVLFLLTLLGNSLILVSDNLWLITLAYSWTILLFNGSNPVMEKIATSSPYTYGKIRIWGTIGYAMGAQLAGLIYDYVAPSAIFKTFFITMLLAVFGLWGTATQSSSTSEVKKELASAGAPTQSIWTKTFIVYVLLAMVLMGVNNMGHTYIPSMLEHAGLSVGLSTTVVSLSVICEAPLIFFSYRFMDKMTSKHLAYISASMMFIQYLVYALDMGVASLIVVTLLSKHAAGMLFVMLNIKIVSSLVEEHHVITALAWVQTAKSLASICLQYLAGYLIDSSGYSLMSWVITLIICLITVGFVFLKLPAGTDKRLFS